MIEITLSEARPGIFRADSTEYGSLSCSRTPFYDAARALLKFGADPETTVVVRAEGSDAEVARSTVAKLARWTADKRGEAPTEEPAPTPRKTRNAKGA